MLLTAEQFSAARLVKLVPVNGQIQFIKHLSQEIYTNLTISFTTILSFPYQKSTDFRVRAEVTVRKMSKFCLLCDGVRSGRQLILLRRNLLLSS